MAKGNQDFEKALKDATKMVGKALKSRLATPTSTWHHKPQFVEKMSESGGDLIYSVYTDDNPYFFLDGGTDARYAVMTQGFQPKTTPNSFTARVGKGGLAYRLKKKWKPRPGIEKRNWTEMAAAEYGSILPSAIDRIVAQYGDGKRLFSLARRVRGVIDE